MVVPAHASKLIRGLNNTIPASADFSMKINGAFCSIPIVLFFEKTC